MCCHPGNIPFIEHNRFSIIFMAPGMFRIVNNVGFNLKLLALPKRVNL